MDTAEVAGLLDVERTRGPLMLARRRRIAELVEAKRVVRVAELVELFDVSDVTIRNDLEALAKEGIIVRDHGGAVAKVRTSLSTAFGQRALLNLESKQRISETAISMLSPGDTVLLDAGTTLMEMAKRLPATLPMTVITNSLNIAAEVGVRPQVHVILAGGSLSTETISTVGPLTERDIRELLVDKLFLGIHAIDLEVGLSDVSLDVAKVKATMIAASKSVILLADSTKFPMRALARVAPLSEIDCLITDKGFPEKAAKEMASQGIEVHRV
jgi:DeoR family transcriptional regulator, aga operon transcriptional repressor